MTKKRFAWNLLSILCMVALFTSGMWVKAADAADITHLELILKDEMGKPVGQANCQFRGEDGKPLGTAISSMDGRITAMAHPGANLVCVSKEPAVHTGKVKAGSKHVTTKKQSLLSLPCWMCSFSNPGDILQYEQCMKYCKK